MSRISSLFLITLLFVCSECEETVKTLCEDPYIFSADRLPNNTYRVYRGDYYWVLDGLPDRVARVNGPFKIVHQYMAPVKRETSIMTVGGGPQAGKTWKFEGQKLWQWNADGSLVVGGKGGADWKFVPKGGFSCAMNDGDLDHKGHTRMIALKSIYVYYWSTDETIFDPIGDYYKGYKNGQFGEKFPVDVTACMAFKGSDDKKIYSVYLFKQKKYCFRPITGEEGCKEWRDSKELFGCKNDGSGNGEGKDGGSDGGKDGGSPPETPGKPKPEDQKPPAPDDSQPANDGSPPIGDEKGSTGGCVGKEIKKLLLLLAFCLILKF